MKILLTGHQGFIGKNFLGALQNAGHEVEVYEWGDKYPVINGKDWLIHLGAISSTAETDVNKIMLQNVESTIDLYNDCRRYSVNFQFSSSASVYGLGSDFSETAAVDPRSPYAWSKYLVERYLSKNVSPALVQVFRYFNVYGPGEAHKTQPSPHFAFRKQQELQGYVNLFEGSDKFLRDFIHVDAVIEHQMAFMNRVTLNGTFNIGTGQTQSFLDIAKSITHDIRYIPMPENLKHQYQTYTCADMTKTNNTLALF